MREYLRRTADEGWIIDLSPEKFRPDVATRIFAGVQHKLCIAIFARFGIGNRDTPARINYSAVTGDRESKSRQLASLSEAGTEWVECGSGWQDPFAPTAGQSWQQFPALGDLMPWSTTGITPNRNWVHAPDAATLQERWSRLILAAPEDKARLLKETDTRGTCTTPEPLPGSCASQQPLGKETSTTARLERVALRSFDRQYVIYDSRVIDRPRTELWQVRGHRQVYVTEQHAHPIEDGPGLVFAGFVPGVHHFNGRGGRVLPLYRDPETLAANLAPGLTGLITARLKTEVSADDMLAYIAALAAHPSYTRRFANDLKTPGIRVPLTADPALWAEGVALGRRVIWLHTYGERFADPGAGRPKGAPVISGKRRPKAVTTIPASNEQMPENISYDPVTEILHVGAGEIRPVPQCVWEYEVSGMRIIQKWFDYRKRKPRRKRTSPLDDVNAREWPRAFTTELLDLLNVLCLCVELELQQATLLDRVCAAPMITVADLEEAEVLPVPISACKAPSPKGTDQLPLP